MTRAMERLLVSAVACCLFSPRVGIEATANEQVATASASSEAQATLQDFAWMEGRWTGMAGRNRLENVCSSADKGHMMCMFRSFDENGVTDLEMISLRQKPDGIEEHIRFLNPDLRDDADQPVVLHLVDFAPHRAVWVNRQGTVPKQTTLTWNEAGETMNSHIEIVDAQGKTTTIDARWEKSK